MAGAVDFDAEYRIYDGKTRLNGEELTRRFLSLHMRTVALEEKGASWDELEAAGLGVALRRLDAVITPLILETQGKITDLNEQIADGLALLEAKVAEAEARLDLIIAGGLPAADVAESGTRVFVTPEQRTRIGLAALADDVAASFLAVGASLTDGLALKLDKASKASTTEAKAGTDDTKYLTPAKGKALLDAFGIPIGDIVVTSRTPSADYLRCDGAKYLRTAYPDLVGVLGFINDNLDGYPSAPGSIGSGLTALAFGAGLYVAVGNNQIKTSPDLVTWTTRAAPAWSQGGSGLSAVTFGVGNQFVAIGDRGACATSPDGITWTGRNIGTTTEVFSYQSIAASSTRVIALSENNRFFTSTDGINWTEPPSIYGPLASIVVGGVGYAGGFFFVGVRATQENGVSNDGPRILHSADGVTWARNKVNSGDIRPCSFAYGNGVWVAVAEVGNSTFYSTDLAAGWQGVTGSNPGTRTVAFGQGIFFSGGNYSGLGVSLDGKAWAQHFRSGYPNGSDGARWNAFISAAGRFAMVMSYQANAWSFTSYTYDPATQFAVPKAVSLANAKMIPYIRAKVS